MKMIDKWCVARFGTNPCELCKRHIERGEYYWGRSTWRFCFDCAPGVAAVPPPVRYFAIATYRPDGYELREFTWDDQPRGHYEHGIGGPITPPCDAACRKEHDHLGELDCPFGSCPFKVAAPSMEGDSS